MSLKNSFGFFVILSMAACSPVTVYDDFVELEGSVWNKFNVVGFDFQVTDPHAEYDIYLLVDYAAELHGMVLSFNSELLSPDGESRLRDIDILLNDKHHTNPDTGNYNIFQIKVPLVIDARLSKVGKGRVEIASRMVQYNTPGIVRFGLIIQKH